MEHTKFLSVLLILVTLSNVLGQENSTEIQYIKYVDSETNETRVIDLQELPDYTVLQRSFQVAELYLLFTRNNPTISQQLILNDANSITSSNYNAAAQTVVVVHGWGGNKNSLNAIRDAYLSVMEANIIIVDWSRLSSRNYITASLGTPGVGRTLGRFLAFLRATAGASYSNMHLIGFSLGAHLVGNAGDYLNGRVARITGLDPAGPLWGALNLNRLSANDAVYVEAIHTNAAVLGTTFRSGDVDFYPNGGGTQPGCSFLTSCSHGRSWQMFATTVMLNHLSGRKCSNGLSQAINMCYGPSLPMGNTELLKAGSGQYRLKTQGTYPYRQIY